MNKMTPDPAYRLLSSLSNKLILFGSHYGSPCILHKKKIEPGPIFLMFWMCAVEKNLQKLLNTQKGPRNIDNVHIQIFPTEAEEGKLVSIFFMTILLILSDTLGFEV